MADCKGRASTRLAFLRKVLAISVIIVVVCWPTSHVQCREFPKKPLGDIISICPTHTLNGSSTHCNGEVPFLLYMNSMCSERNPRKATGNDTVTLELMPGIHKVTIPVPVKRLESKGQELEPLYEALYWKCISPISISGSDPAKTIILVEFASSASKKTRFKTISGQVVPIHFSSKELVSFRNVTFRSAVPYMTYALILFHAKNIELSDCNFPDLDELHGGIAIKASRHTSRKGAPAALITDCKFNVTYTMTDGPRQDTSRLAPALRVGVYWKRRAQTSNHTEKKKKRSLRVEIVRSSFQVFGVFRNERSPGKRGMANSSAYR